MSLNEGVIDRNSTELIDFMQKVNICYLDASVYSTSITRQSSLVGSFFFGRFLELLGGFLAHDSVPVGGGLQFPEFFSRSLCIVKKLNF